MASRSTQPKEKGFRVINEGLESVALAKLKPHPKNPRQGDVGAIYQSIEANGFYGSVVAQKSTGHVLAGNHRLLAAQQSNATEIPVTWVDVDDATALRILLADNRTNDLASYDDGALAELLQSIKADAGTLDGTGYDVDALDELLADIGRETEEPEPEEPPPADIEHAAALAEAWGTAPGQVWKIGGHRLHIGDSRDADAVSTLLGGAKINVGVTSPPYASQRKYDDDTDFRPIPPSAYVDWFEEVQKCVAQNMAADGSWFVNITEASDDGCKQDYVKRMVLAHIDSWGWHWIEEYAWLRPSLPLNPNMSRRFKNGWESVYHFARSIKYKFNPDAVRHESDAVFSYDDQKAAGKMVGGTGQGRGGGTMSPVNQQSGLAYPSNVIDNARGGAKVVGHSAAFPVGLPEFFIKAFSDPGDNIYDPFAGSGTTLVAAEQNGRRGYGMEISPKYAAVILQRLADMGLAPTLEAP